MTTTERPIEQVVLEALLCGLPVKLDNYVYRMIDDGSLCIEATRTTFEDGFSITEQCLLGADMSFGEFIRETRKLDEAQRLELVSNITLTKYNRERVK